MSCWHAVTSTGALSCWLLLWLLVHVRDHTRVLSKLQPQTFTVSQTGRKLRRDWGTPRGPLHGPFQEIAAQRDQP
jgi:hypothetical protein